MIFINYNFFAAIKYIFSAYGAASVIEAANPHSYNNFAFHWLLRGLYNYYALRDVAATSEGQNSRSGIKCIKMYSLYVYLYFTVVDIAERRYINIAHTPNNKSSGCATLRISSFGTNK